MGIPGAHAETQLFGIYSCGIGSGLELLCVDVVQGGGFLTRPMHGGLIPELLLVHTEWESSRDINSNVAPLGQPRQAHGVRGMLGVPHQHMEGSWWKSHWGSINPSRAFLSLESSSRSKTSMGYKCSPGKDNGGQRG